MGRALFYGAIIGSMIWFPSNIFLFIQFPNISISIQPQTTRLLKISYLPIIDMKASHNLPLGYACIYIEKERESIYVYSISRMMLNNFFFFIIKLGKLYTRKIQKYRNTRTRMRLLGNSLFRM